MGARRTAVADFFLQCLYATIGKYSISESRENFDSGWRIQFNPTESIHRALLPNCRMPGHVWLQLTSQTPNRPASAKLEIEGQCYLPLGDDGPRVRVGGKFNVEYPDALLGLENLKSKAGTAETPYSGVLYNLTPNDHQCNLYDAFNPIAVIYAEAMVKLEELANHQVNKPCLVV
jgi:hypothetical protein